MTQNVNGGNACFKFLAIKETGNIIVLYKNRTSERKEKKKQFDFLILRTVHNLKLTPKHNICEFYKKTRDNEKKLGYLKEKKRTNEVGSVKMRKKVTVMSITQHWDIIWGLMKINNMIYYTLSALLNRENAKLRCEPGEY